MKTKSIFNHVDCVRLYVPDLQKGYEYYHDKLGLKLVWKTNTDMGFIFNDQKTELVIQNHDHYQETDIKVDSVNKVVEEIKKAGGKVIKGPLEIKIGKYAVVEDPWGNRLCILDSTKGTFATDEKGNVISISLNQGPYTK